MISDHLDRIISIIVEQWAWWWEGSNKKDELARAILTVSILILAIFWSIWTYGKSRKGMSNSLPPGPLGLPIVGYLPFLGTDLHVKFAELANCYGPIYKLWLGNKLCVVVSSPSVAKEVVRDQDANFANRDPPIAALVFTYGGLDIAWSSYGSHWRDMRKLLVREMLSNVNLDACYNLRRDEVRRTIGDLYTQVGKPMNIGEIAFLTEFNVIRNMLWGSILGREETRRLGTEFRDIATKMVELMGKPNISDVYPMLAGLDIQGVERQSRSVMQRAERILDAFIDVRMKMETENMEGGKKDFLQILLELKEREDATSSPINMMQIKAIFMDIVLGGTDTTSTTVEWVMAEIMRNRDVMKKVQDELTNHIGMNNIVEESHLSKLQYLDAVVKETYRLYPPVPLLVPRRPSQSCIVSGYTIPKDTKIFLNVWALHRDPQVWDNPSDFKPERFLNDPAKWDYTGNNFQYLPFGSGRRICAGIPLAEKMVMYLLASLLHSFDWHLQEGEELDLSEKFGIVLKKRTPLMVIPSQRLSNLDLYV